MGIGLAHARSGEAADETASRRADTGTRQRGHKPPGGNHRTDTRDSEETEAGEQANRAARHCAKRCARSRASLGVVFGFSVIVASPTNQAGMAVTLVVAD